MQELNSYVIETMHKSKSLDDWNQIDSLYQIHDQINKCCLLKVKRYVFGFP